VLPGVTRRSLLRLAAERAIAVEERPFTLEEAYAAQEAFLTSASTLVMPVVEIDGHRSAPVGPSPAARAIYLEAALAGE
jgi:D-alanine transaminase